MANRARIMTSAGGLAAGLALGLGLAACGAEAPDGAPNGAEAGNRVATTGKSEVPLAEVPPEAMAAAQAARPGFTATEAERETRDGRTYFDIGGRLPDGSEIEFDIMAEGGSWRVVETQRDIPLAAAPAPVAEAIRAHEPGFAPTRVIESVQADGLVIYELYAEADGDPQGRKVEIRWDGNAAEVLEQEWAH